MTENHLHSAPDMQQACIWSKANEVFYPYIHQFAEKVKRIGQLFANNKRIKCEGSIS